MYRVYWAGSPNNHLRGSHVGEEEKCDFFGIPHFLIAWNSEHEMKRNESGFRPPLCTYRLNWARRTPWGWWDDWDDTVLQTQDSKFEPWRSEAEHATSRSRRLPTILTFTRVWGRNIFCFFQTAETGNLTPNSGVKGSGANHYPRAPALRAWKWQQNVFINFYSSAVSTDLTFYLCSYFLT